MTSCADYGRTRILGCGGSQRSGKDREVRFQGDANFSSNVTWSLSPPVPGANYGIDAPKLVQRFAVRGGLLVVFAAVLYIVNRRTSPGTALALALACGGIGLGFLATAGIMIWSSRIGKLRVRDEILNGIAWRGDETVLDLGCGRGLLLIGAAKRLKTSRATGVDSWSAENLSGNTAEAVMENAKAEGVADRIRLETSDLRKLPFGDKTFDVAVSGLAIHNIPVRDQRAKALAEIVRVLKPGGRVAIFDLMYPGEYAKALGELGLSDVKVSGYKFLWCLPGRIVTARKS